MTREEKNVFRDAKFGDKFLTRNGQIMIYQKQAREDVYCLFDEESDCVIEYCSNGDVIYEYTGNAEPQEDDIVKKYVQPSLPSNLDEAAEKYAWRKEEPLSDGERLSFCFNPRIDAFKTGAKWMAEQGSSFKVNIEEVPQGHWYAGLHLGRCAEEEENALKSINAKDGEEVIVQIRKKEE